ncbi:hypothetical protein PENTCL1PPCAC_4347, partial [Pristionchus entomophagus]
PNLTIIPAMLEQLSSTCNIEILDPTGMDRGCSNSFRRPVHRQGFRVQIECGLAHAVGCEVTGRAGAPCARNRSQLGGDVHDLRGAVGFCSRFQQILE